VRKLPDRTFMIRANYTYSTPHEIGLWTPPSGANGSWAPSLPCPMLANLLGWDFSKCADR
jgi:hypothetical protein